MNKSVGYFFSSRFQTATFGMESFTWNLVSYHEFSVFLELQVLRAVAVNFSITYQVQYNA